MVLLASVARMERSGIRVSRCCAISRIPLRFIRAMCGLWNCDVIFSVGRNGCGTESGFLGAAESPYSAALHTGYLLALELPRGFVSQRSQRSPDGAQRNPGFSVLRNSYVWALGLRRDFVGGPEWLREASVARMERSGIRVSRCCGIPYVWALELRRDFVGGPEWLRHGIRVFRCREIPVFRFASYGLCVGIGMAAWHCVGGPGRSHRGTPDSAALHPGYIVGLLILLGEKWFYIGATGSRAGRIFSP